MARLPGKMLSEPGTLILALRSFLETKLIPRKPNSVCAVSTYTGDYRWLCKHPLRRMAAEHSQM
ncbi:MAG: hypothetical protein IPL71_22350 [Anaerolineales bacterium]|uniref:hypothetical protein n=1 Tax=Candidatus Villigracilis proximus TaxID=3140683 RepID=UPI0031375EBE|nr:hypothetical protein [Anaerolineales bacterium]